jgi:DsbC/DsbD-like thiol-disulfide interchange protein
MKKNLALFILVFINIFFSQSFASPKNEERYSADFILGNYNEKEGFLWAAIQLNLYNDWKTYWKTPGYGGIAPKITWAKNENIKNIEFLWTAPTYLKVGDTVNYVYKNNMILPMKIYLQDKNVPPFLLNMTYKLGMCNNICLQETKKFKAKIDLSHVNKTNQLVINDALKNVPQPFEKSSCKISNVTNTQKKVDLHLKITLIGCKSRKTEIFFYNYNDIEQIVPKILYFSDSIHIQTGLKYVPKNLNMISTIFKIDKKSYFKDVKLK